MSCPKSFAQLWAPNACGEGLVDSPHPRKRGNLAPQTGPSLGATLARLWRVIGLFDASNDAVVAA